MTDLEFYEVRYSERRRASSAGSAPCTWIPVQNCIIMATVNLAACKIAASCSTGRWQTLLLVGVLNVVFATVTGLWGVLVIDMIQFFIKMTAVTAAAFFAIKAVGGLDTMLAKPLGRHGPNGVHFLNMLRTSRATGTWPSPSHHAPGRPVVAVWLPGRRAGGGQLYRPADAGLEVEKDSLGAVLFFNNRPTTSSGPGRGSSSPLLDQHLPQLGDIQKAFPTLRPRASSDTTSPTPPMLKFMPVGSSA